MRDTSPIEEIKRAIESPQPPPCFLFIAWEPYLAEQCIQQLRSEYISKELEEFNLDILRGWETSYQEICQRCLSLPVMSPRRMVLVKDAEKVEDGYVRFLEEYLKNSSPTTILIFIYNSTSIKAVFKLLKKYGSIHYFSTLPENRLKEWVENHARQQGYRVNADAISYLLDQTGSDLIKLDSELKKIELMKGEKGEISLEELQSLIGRSQRLSAFDLANAVGRKRMDESLKMLHRLIEDGEEPLKILGALQYRFRQLIRLKHLLARKLGETEIIKQMNLSKFNYKELKEQSRLFSFLELSQVFQFFCQTDKLLKSSQLRAQFYLEQLILDLISGRGFLSKRRQTKALL